MDKQVARRKSHDQPSDITWPPPPVLARFWKDGREESGSRASVFLARRANDEEVKIRHIRRGGKNAKRREGAEGESGGRRAEPAEERR